MTGSKVTRQVPYLSGVVHYMPIKLDVMEGLLRLLEQQDPKKQGEAWKAIVGWIDPKVHNSLSEYELYFNYALEHHKSSVRIKQLLFANGPMPGFVYTAGDEGSMGQPTWSRHQKSGLLKQVHGVWYMVHGRW